MLLFLLACKTDVPTEPTEPTGPFEGDDAGECSDGADNDRDGLFDCDDDDCVNAPSCNGAPDADSDSDADADTDADTDSDTDADADTDTDTDVGHCSNDLCNDLSSVELDYTLVLSGTVNCRMDFVGDGTVYAGEDEWVRFEGTWERTNSTCIPQFDEVVWFEPTDEGYHTFVFNSTRTEVREWYAHRDETDHTTGSQRFYITEMFEDIDLAVASPAFQHLTSDGDPFVTGNHTLNVTFDP